MVTSSHTFKELIHSRPLDVFLTSSYPEVKKFLDDIYCLLPSSLGSKKNVKKNLKVLLLNLYVAWTADPLLKIAVSHDNNSFKAKTRYNELYISKIILRIIDELKNLGFIDKAKGFHDPQTKVGYVTRIWSEERLTKLFKEARFSQFMIRYSDDTEMVVLRDERGEDIPNYEDTPETWRMRNVLKKYNLLLDSVHIDLDYVEVPVIVLGASKRNHRLQVNQSSKLVRRIFNNGQWNQGGRFYGGWWQRCPSKLRPHITFDGILTEEVDYSGLHIVLLYAQKGINYWEEIGSDPYDVVPPIDWPEDVDVRSAAKLLLLTAINADKTTKAFKAFRRQAETGSSEKRLTDSQLSSLLETLRAKHSAIENDFNTGVGVDLMFLDSQITEKLISYFTDLNIPILAIHDSYIVPHGYSYLLIEQMKVACEAVTGVADVHVKHTTVNDQAWAYADLWTDDDHKATGLVMGPPSARHLREVEEFKTFKGKPEREDWVAKNTYIY